MVKSTVGFVKIIRIRDRKIRGWGGWGWSDSGEWLLMNTGFILGVMGTSWNYIVVMIVQLYEYTKNHRIVYFKGVHFMLCDLNSI